MGQKPKISLYYWARKRTHWANCPVVTMLKDALHREDINVARNMSPGLARPSRVQLNHAIYCVVRDKIESWSLSFSLSTFENVE